MHAPVSFTNLNRCRFSGLFFATRSFHHALRRRDIHCSRGASHIASKMMAQNRDELPPVGEFASVPPPTAAPREGAILEGEEAAYSPLFDTYADVTRKNSIARICSVDPFLPRRKLKFPFDGAEMQAVIQERSPSHEEAREHPVVQTRIAGVSFEGRQEILSSVDGNPPVILERERMNPHDPNALKVSLLDGRQLGYVPRTDLHHFENKDVSFGRVAYVGKNDDVGLYGALIHTQPSLPYFTLTCAPDEIFIFKKLLDNLTSVKGKKWKKAEMMDSTGHKCAITGISDAIDVTVAERWESDFDYPVMILQGLRSICTVLADLEQKPLHDIDPEDCALMAAVNRWSVEEAIQYLDLCKATKDSLPEAKQWVIDISILHRLGIFQKYPRSYAAYLGKAKGCGPIDVHSNDIFSECGTVTLEGNIHPTEKAGPRLIRTVQTSV
ncbi:hypothetical protein BSKO_07365 [Bryopsis sp. KO-2023]|nr:hypothetical protein BSKO_07365 [Bryopsis sp. KO-2023]